MATYVIFSSQRARLQANDTTWAGARGGANADANQAYVSPFFFSNMLGERQYNMLGVRYGVGQLLLGFDTSVIPANAVIESVELVLAAGGRSGAPDVTVQARARDFGATIEAADFVPGATFAGLPLLGQATISAGATGEALRLKLGSDTAPARINRTGTTRLVLASARFAGNTPPPQVSSSANDPTALITGADSADQNSSYPYLIVRAHVPSTTTDVANAEVSVAGGVTASIRSNGAANPTLTLGFSTLTAGFATISALTGWATGYGVSSVALAASPNGDLYVIGGRSGTVGSWAVQKFTRDGTSNSWTAGPIRTGNFNASSPFRGWAAAFVPGSPGSILVSASQAPWSNSDAGVLVAFTVNLAYVEDGQTGVLASNFYVNPAWLARAGTSYWRDAPGDLVDVAPSREGSGGPHVIASRVLSVVNVSAAGAVTAHPAGKRDLDAVGQRMRVVPLYDDAFAVVYPRSRVSAGEVPPAATLAVELYTYAGGLGQAYASFEIDGSTIAGGAGGLGWDAYFDRAYGVIRLYRLAAADSRRLERLDISPNATSLPAAVTVSGAVGAAGTTNSSISIPTGIVDERRVLIETSNTASNGTTLSTISTFDTAGNATPVAPTLDARATFSAGNAATFSWTYNDGNRKDAQTAYQLEITRVSDSVVVFDSGKITSASSQHVLPANTLANDTAYRWRVRTWDGLNTTGAYATPANFSTTSSGVVTITRPAADNPAGIDTSSVVVEWTFAQAGGATQSQRRVRALRTSNSAVVHDSGLTTTASTSYTVPGLLSGVEYTLEVSVISSAGGGQSQALRRVTPSYTSPMTPSLTLSAEELAVVVNIINPAPTGDRPEIDRNTLYRRPTGETAWTAIAVVGRSLSYRDFEAASGMSYDYFVRSLAGSVEVDSEVVSITAAMLFGSVVHLVSSPATTIAIFPHVSRSRKRAVESERMRFAGRRYAVVERGEGRDDELALSVTIPFGDDYAAGRTWWRNALNTGAVLCYRDNRGRLMHSTVEELDESDLRFGTALSVTLARVDYSGPIQ